MIALDMLDYLKKHPGKAMTSDQIRLGVGVGVDFNVNNAMRTPISHGTVVRGGPIKDPRHGKLVATYKYVGAPKPVIDIKRASPAIPEPVAVAVPIQEVLPPVIEVPTTTTLPKTAILTEENPDMMLAFFKKMLNINTMADQVALLLAKVDTLERVMADQVLLTTNLENRLDAQDKAIEGLLADMNSLVESVEKESGNAAVLKSIAAQLSSLK